MEECDSLLNIIPYHLIQSFKNLKEIKVNWCENLRHVFHVQGYDDADHVQGNINILNQGGVHFLGEVSFLQYSFSLSLYYFLVKYYEKYSMENLKYYLNIILMNNNNKYTKVI